jgi:beta-galactosidase GanA
VLSSCFTFNDADISNLKARGWNAIRLGVVWAGAQPSGGDALDAAFVGRLHAILDLCDEAGISVVLDNHGDMVGSAGCGNGVPMWFQQEVSECLQHKKNEKMIRLLSFISQHA